jgi:putative ABC transport system ATP-binding protein
LQRVSKNYDHLEQPVTALHEINLTVGRGEFVAIMGPSGSGKSTLLNLLSALDKPTTGRILLAGADIGAMSDDAVTTFRREKIGLIFQFFNLLPTMTAVENVLLPVLLARRAQEADRQKAIRLLEQVGLGHRLTHKPSAMSGGEMQRVAVARAFMTEPPILLADEPTGNLDSNSGTEVLRLLRRQAEEHGTSVVMVTHDANAARVGSRLIVIRDGSIQSDAPVSAHDSGPAAPPLTSDAYAPPTA